MNSLQSLIKQHNDRSSPKITLIWLAFNIDTDINKEMELTQNLGRLEEVDLQKSFREVQRSSFTKWIIELLAPKHVMPVNLKIYDGSTDPDDYISRFVRAANQGEWQMLVWCRMFQQILDGLARGWFDHLENGRQMRRCRLSKSDGWMRLRFLDHIPRTVTDMMKRVDDFVKSEEAFERQIFQEGSSLIRAKSMDIKMRRFLGWQEARMYEPPRSGLESLTKFPKEILATKPLLRLPPTLLRRQLEIALESGNLNHMLKDVRQKGGHKGNHWENPTRHHDGGHDGKEAEIEGYLVRRVLVDEGAAVHIMFEHCFKNLPTGIEARLAETQHNPVGFLGEELTPLGKIELEVAFENGGLVRRTMMKFTVVRAASSYNGRIATLISRKAIISKCQRLKEKQLLRAENTAEGKNCVPKNQNAVGELVEEQPGCIRMAAVRHGRDT
ncbi:hypothetical protein Tco_0331835 [Tanacetum coccineum]